MVSFIFSSQVSVTATIACTGIALAEQYQSRQVRKSILGQQFVIMKIVQAQVYSQFTTHAFLPDISYASGLLTLIDKFSFFGIADNYGIKQLILHYHLIT